MRPGTARRDWLQQLRLVCSIMLMRLQELCKTCANLVECFVILFYFILFYFIYLLQMGERLLAGRFCSEY